MIDTLSAEELDQLEAILGKPLDEKTELQMIQAELQQLGMDPQDVQDMFDLSEMMKKFLLKISDVDTKLQLDEDDYSLEDHCKLYLLGLPNKLGPLGFLALQELRNISPIFNYQIESKHNKLKQIRNHFIIKLINTLAKFRVGYVHKKVFSYFIGNPTDKKKN